MMTDERTAKAMNEPMIQRLVTETGISEAQARELVLLMGLNWASLIREARLINKRH